MIRIENLSFSYPNGVSALVGVSLSMARGESVGIVGNNGAGKSTLVNHLNGALFPSSGSVNVAGLEVSKKSAEQVRRSVGLVFQDPDDMLFMPRIIDDVMFGPLNLGRGENEARRKAEATLQSLGIWELHDRPPFTLSQGQKRFAAIAAVLVMEPAVLVMDEPTSDLDPKNRRRLINLLNGLSMTKILVSHDLDFIWDTCSRTILLYRGRVMKDGPCQKTLSDKFLLESNGLELPLRLQK
jgi:cobalt/nickel transport system ATP-binding protein